MSHKLRTKKKTVKFLTLGDGDFTYSLDLARYLAESYPNPSEAQIELVASGIDSLEDLSAKYKDSSHILHQLESVRKEMSSFLSVTIRHEINAIFSSSSSSISSSDSAFALYYADHVIFNHPHLGTEDAALHSRFLCHFFYSCVKFWMNPEVGVLHLTLVKGQYERWNCAKAAEDNGLVLLQRVPFVAPPVKSPAYHYRRHQTGKSFESRRPGGSETFSYGFQKYNDIMYPSKGLPWQEEAKSLPSPDGESALINCSRVDDRIQQVLSCPYCEKKFREERSQKCHIRDKHPDGAVKKAKQNVDPPEFFCEHCRSETGEARIFSSAEALKDNCRAKHLAIHKYILPDWHQPQDDNQSRGIITKFTSNHRECDEENYQTLSVPSSSEFGFCSVCGLKFQNEEDGKIHLSEFTPLDRVKTFQCSFCAKIFREKRAKLQHENFCAIRITDD